MELHRFFRYAIEKMCKEKKSLNHFIINILGEKGREVRIDYVSDLLQNKFANKFKNNFDYELYFDSQINILIYKNKFKIL
jgi:hypothetical protein